MHELSGLLPATNLKGKHFFLMDYGPTPELAPLYLLPLALSVAEGNSLKTTHIFLLQTRSRKGPSTSGLRACLSFPPSPAADSLNYTSQDLVLFPASTWLKKSFLLAKLSALKVFM